ncbi:hypothetical protein ACNKHW_22370 [Shigella flexneri]
MINVTGTASFASEQLDLTIHPESKGIRIITLRLLLYVRGRLKICRPGVKAGPLDRPCRCCGTGNAGNTGGGVTLHRSHLPKGRLISVGRFVADEEVMIIADV